MVPQKFKKVMSLKNQMKKEDCAWMFYTELSELLLLSCLSFYSFHCPLCFIFTAIQKGDYLQYFFRFPRESGVFLRGRKACKAVVTALPFREVCRTHEGTCCGSRKRDWFAQKSLLVAILMELKFCRWLWIQLLYSFLTN